MNSVLKFFLSTTDLMIGRSKKNSQEKIVQENAFDEKKKKRDPG